MQSFRLTIIVLAACVVFAGCEKDNIKAQSNAPLMMKDVASVRLNYRYEGDVPAPAAMVTISSDPERNGSIQADFDNNRPQELLDRTITSPDKRHVFAVYRNVADPFWEFRIDAYSPEGKLLRKATSDAMAVYYPDTIVWSPDSSSLAFVAKIPAPRDVSAVTLTPAPSDPAAEPTFAITAPTPPAPTGILTFRTEQIYICGADGQGLKAVTQNEGLIYFYYVWSPDSSMLAALATTAREWRYLEVLADGKGETMVPVGRPRIVEKTGRERLLDDNLTAVHPVWSPDSAKIATAFATQVRVYDALGINPTQAAIPLRNQLLISSQTYDRDQSRKLQSSNTNSDTNTTENTPAATPDQPLTTLPDEKLLVSYNPIVEVEWMADDLFYLKTAYMKRMKNEADSVTSFARWHRLALTPQIAAPLK